MKNHMLTITSPTGEKMIIGDRLPIRKQSVIMLQKGKEMFIIGYIKQKYEKLFRAFLETTEADR